MATKIDAIQRPAETTTSEYLHATDSFNAPGATDPVRLARDIVVQISGTATSIDAVLERSVVDPNGASNNWAPAEDEHFTGDMTVGIASRQYFEPIQGFYRLHILSISGGVANVSILGSSAS